MLVFGVWIKFDTFFIKHHDIIRNEMDSWKNGTDVENEAEVISPNRDTVDSNLPRKLNNYWNHFTYK